MYQYRPQNEDELELQEGDRVDVMQQCDDGWFVGMWAWRGQAGRGISGSPGDGLRGGPEGGTSESPGGVAGGADQREYPRILGKMTWGQVRREYLGVAGEIWVDCHCLPGLIEQRFMV